MLMLALVAWLNLAGCPAMALGLCVAGPPWKPVVYAHRATGTGAASLRASAAGLIRAGVPRRVVVRAVWRFVAGTDTWERLRVPLPGPVRLPVPPARQVYSGDTDQVLLVIPDPVGLFWAEWEEDDHRVTGFVFAGPMLCNDVMLGPAPPAHLPLCVPFADHAEARFVPDPPTPPGGS
jgi:hypothetical protein